MAHEGIDPEGCERTCRVIGYRPEARYEIRVRSIGFDSNDDNLKRSVGPKYSLIRVIST